MGDTVRVSIKSLIKKLCNITTEVNFKVDGYLSLFSYFQKEKDIVTVLMKLHINKLLSVLQTDINNQNITLAESSLSVLGQCLASEDILRHADAKVITKNLQVLCSNLESQENKSVCIRTLWCFTNQHISADIIQEYVSIVVHQFIKLSSCKNQKSELIICEGLQTMRRFCEQCPDEMEKLAKIWFIELFLYVLSEVPKIRDCCLELIEASMVLLLNQQNYLSAYLLEQLNKGDLSESLKASFEKGSCPVHVLNTWACVLRLLGTLFFELNRVTVLNPLLKIAEKSFTATNSEICLALNNMWKSLMDVVFLVPGGFSKRMEKIFLLPIQIKYRNEVVANEYLKTNWHLICNINETINTFVDKLIIPLVSLYLCQDSNDKPSIESPSTVTDHLNRRRSRNYTPYVCSTSTKILAAEILIQLFMKPEDRIKTKLKLEIFKGPSLDESNLVTYFPKLYLFVLNATESYLSSNENEATQLWAALFSAYGDINNEGEHYKSIWKELILGLKKVWEQSTSSVTFIMRTLLIIPEATLYLRNPEFQFPSNDAGLTSLFIIKMLLHKEIFENGGLEQERYFILFERMITVLFKGLSNQLQSSQFVFTMLVHAAKKFKSDDICWRLWSTISCLLEDYVCRTGDVNQGDSLKFEFHTLLDALVFPLKYICLSKLNDGTKKELLKVWTELYTAFSRSVNLLPGVESNLAMEEFFTVLHVYITNQSNGLLIDPNLLNILIDIGFVALENVNWSDSILSLTPSKINKRRRNPLGNLKSFGNVIVFLLNMMSQKVEKGESCGYEKTFLRLFDLVEKFYVSVNNSALLVEWSCSLVPSLVTVLSFCPKYSNKVNMNIEKMISTIFSTFEITSQNIFHSDLLRLFEPFLIECFKSDRKSLRTRAAKFWNNTFAKTTVLDYSDNLKETFLNHSSKIHLILPSFIDRVPSPDLHVDITQFSDSPLVSLSPKLKSKSPNVVSPVKIFGSFLQDGRSPIPKKSPVTKLFNSPVSQLKECHTKITPKNANVFIEICESPKRRRILTEHQKEKLRERHSFPAMYNNLDQSQDTTLLNTLTQDSLSQSTSLSELDNNSNIVGNTSNNNLAFKEPSSICNQANDVTEVFPTIVFTDTNKIIPKIGEIEDNNLNAKDVELLSMDILQDDNVTDSLSPEIILSSQASSQSPNKMKLSILSPAITTKVDSPNSIKQPAGKFHKTIESGKLALSCDKEKWLTTDKLSNKKNEGRSENSRVPSKIKKRKTIEKIVALDSKCSPQKSCAQIIEKIVEEKKECQNQFLEKLKNACDLNLMNSLKGVCDLDLTKNSKSTSNKVKTNLKRKRGRPVSSQNKRKKYDLNFVKDDEKCIANINPPLINSKEERTSSLVEISYFEDSINCNIFDFSQTSNQELNKTNNESVVENEHAIESECVVESESVIENESVTDSETVVKSENECVVEIEIEHVVERESVVECVKKELIQVTSKDINSSVDSELTKNKVETKDETNEALVCNLEQLKIDQAILKAESNSIDRISEEVDIPIHLEIDIPNQIDKDVLEKSSSWLSPSSHIVITKTLCSSPTIMLTPSHKMSPANGILKKKQNMASPPITKSRHVHFQVSHDSKDDIDDLAKPFNDSSDKGYTMVKKKKEFCKKSAIYPQLANCSAPIEKILPSLTFSRGIGHLVRAQNILTIGDLSSLTEKQIENLPIRSPKVTTVRNALRTYAKGKCLPKSPLIVKAPTENLTPPKDDKSLVEEAVLLTTPTRHFDIVKPTSLFSDFAVTMNNQSWEINDESNLYEVPSNAKNLIETSNLVDKDNFNESSSPKIDCIASVNSEHISEQFLFNEDMEDLDSLSKTDASLVNDGTMDPKIDLLIRTDASLVHDDTMDPKVDLLSKTDSIVHNVIIDSKIDSPNKMDAPLVDKTMINSNNDLLNITDSLIHKVMIDSKIDQLSKSDAQNEVCQEHKTDKYTQTDSQNEFKFDISGINVKTLSVYDIFELVDSADALKTKALEELRTRCCGSVKKL